MSKATQTDRVLDYIKQFGSITQYEALQDLGVMRLASRISDLKRAGVPIKREMVGVKNRFGETCYISQYSLEVVE